MIYSVETGDIMILCIVYASPLGFDDISTVLSHNNTITDLILLFEKKWEPMADLVIIREQ